MGAEPPFIPYNSGAAAKASAAMQNEYFARSGGLYHSPYWLTPNISEDNNDDESGVGIAATIPEAKEAHIERVDPVARLPTELAIHIFALLDALTLGKACLVASEWNNLIKSQHIWRESCMRETTGTYAMGRPIAMNTGLGIPKNTPDKDWRRIYKARKELERQWKGGKARPTYLTGHTDSIYCLQFDE
jgi:F-box and WD-40 domain protein 1/11